MLLLMYCLFLCSVFSQQSQRYLTVPVFTIAVKTITENATKSMFTLVKKYEKLPCILIVCHQHFAPILMYGLEIWEFENTNFIERAYLKFLKIAASICTSTPNFMDYGEFGREQL